MTANVLLVIFHMMQWTAHGRDFTAPSGQDTHFCSCFDGPYNLFLLLQCAIVFYCSFISIDSMDGLVLLVTTASTILFHLSFLIRSLL